MGKSALKPRTAAELGIMRGFPPPPEKRPDLTNWDLAPFNRWSFMNIRNLFPTVDVKTDYSKRQALPTAMQDLSAVEFENHAGRRVTLSDFLYSTYTDGFLVLHRGNVVTEQYFNSMQPDTPHLSQSVAKSVVGTLAGILQDQGLIDQDSPLIRYVPELARCGYRDAQLKHALNMTSGIRFVEDYNMPGSDMTRIDIASGWRPVPRDETQPTIRDIILTLPKVRDHGKLFEYKSVETDVVAWVLERAAGKSLAELLSNLIWKKIGAEHNAFFTVDRAATALADGGFNATLRDYARFGQMMQNNGQVGERQVVPPGWVDACASGDRSVYRRTNTDIRSDGAYSNFWWDNNIVAGDFMARGVFGQMIYINREAELTIVKLSTWPDYVITDFKRDSLAAFAAIQQALA
ncbi:MAG: serine hydrolase [Gammaproteobacteria bacterium]|nr:MAG: class C beta-lactamase-related serine hydrolase [Gammaproteobacteria bacterium]UCH39790.1 MAG: serine hydrolase [Gammaproteobacteria bacterium]